MLKPPPRVMKKKMMKGRLIQTHTHGVQLQLHWSHSAQSRERERERERERCLKRGYGWVSPEAATLTTTTAATFKPQQPPLELTQQQLQHPTKSISPYCGNRVPSVRLNAVAAACIWREVHSKLLAPVKKIRL